MKSNERKRPKKGKPDSDNPRAKENKKAKGNPFWKGRKKEKQEEDDNFEEVKADAPTNTRLNEDGR